jgi:hypothetical protein
MNLYLIGKNTLPFLMFFILGISLQLHTVYFIRINEQQKINKQKFNQYYNIELIKNKPPNELIAYPSQVNIFNMNGKQYGKLINFPIVYYHNRGENSQDSLATVTIYGWIWSKSLSNNCKLLKDENIRYWANSHIIARLNAGTRVDTVYTNELKSWTLITYHGYVNKDCLITKEEYENISRFEKLISNQGIKTTITKRSAGVSIKPTTRPMHIPFDNLIWPARLIISIMIFSITVWLLVVFIIPQQKLNKKKRNNLMLTAFVTGFLAGWFNSLFNLF